MDIWPYIIAFVVVDLVVLIIVLVRLQKRKFLAADREAFRRSWQKIRSESDLKHAVMDADKLLDLVLAKKGYVGSLGDKLKAAAPLFGDLDGVWSAHKLRNRLAHELHTETGDREARTALSQFERALNDLGIF